MRLHVLIRIIVIAFGMAYAMSSLALTLTEAKAKGLVGEQPNGYLGVVSPSLAVSALINHVNAERLHYYKLIAKENGTSLLSVEGVAGQTAIYQTRPGYYIRNPFGDWIKKH